MADNKPYWLRLYDQHIEDQNTPRPNAANDLRALLMHLANKKYIAQSSPYAFTYRKNSHPHLREHYLRNGPVDILNCQGLTSCTLSIHLLEHTRTHRMQKVSICVEGRRDDQTGFVLAVHVTSPTDSPASDQPGDGACTHAIAHCHAAPQWECKPDVRVPFPTTDPVHIFQWVLATLFPELEPSPWTSSP